LGLEIPAKQTALRLFPIDVLKAVSIVAVVSFHSIFVYTSTYTSVSYPLDILFAPLKFCVPVLLTISFFLLKRGLEKKAEQPVYLLLKKRLIRLLIPTAFWFSLGIIISKFIWYQDKPHLLISVLQGTISTGAYYLLILFQFVPFFIWLHPWFDRRRNIWLNLFFKVSFFFRIYASLSGMFGSEVPLILHNLDRTLFIYWFVYMVLGSYLYNNWSKIVKISGSITTRIKIALLCLTSLTMIAECSVLKIFTGESMSPYDYVLFSCIVSVIVCFSLLCLGGRKPSIYACEKAIKLLSTYSLGIFCINGCINLALAGLIAPIFKYNTFNLTEMLVMKLLGWVLLLSLSVVLSLGLDKIKMGVFVR
jgi:hypothetical protein